jgi:hypothetical protein
MTVENLKSLPITNLDAIPVIQPTAGEGGPGYARIHTDWVACTITGVASTTSTYRLGRIPTNSKVKQVFFSLKGGDTNATATLAFDINMAFSDSTLDVTQVNLQGTIPTTANTGAVTTVAAYSSPNKLFGTVVAANSGVATYNKDVTFNAGATTYPFSFRDDDLWDVFGFTNNQGYAQDPGGFFDFLLYVSTVAATAAAGLLGIEVIYVV